jgi:pimeloyl-ACP methyl ester carboxylesterase
MTTTGKTTFVLVPGYWLGAWAWDEVAADLRAAGHEVRAVTPAGQAERASGAAPGADVGAQVDDLLRLIEDGDLTGVVLVAHSGANMAVTGAADRIPERIARVVYVDTGPMPSGLAGIDFHDPVSRADLEFRRSIRRRTRSTSPA